MFQQLCQLICLWCCAKTLCRPGVLCQNKQSKYIKRHNSIKCDIDLKNLTSSSPCCQKQYNLKVWLRNGKVIANVKFSWRDRRMDGQSSPYDICIAISSKGQHNNDKNSTSLFTSNANINTGKESFWSLFIRNLVEQLRYTTNMFFSLNCKYSYTSIKISETAQLAARQNLFSSPIRSQVNNSWAFKPLI
jgi:hypothetical protein